MSQPFTLYRSDSLGRASNCMYPHAVEVTDTVSLAAAVSFDYVAVEYKNGYRNNANFIKTNCLMLDCDNDHSEDPAAWITPQVLTDSLLDVAFAVHYSRSNGKVKNGKAARPKFHVFFPIPGDPLRIRRPSDRGAEESVYHRRQPHGDGCRMG